MSKCIQSRPAGHTTAQGAGRTSVPSEIQIMVRLLEARHGALAAAMADFFVTANELKGAEARAEAWQDVAVRIQLRERLRCQAEVDLDPVAVTPHSLS